jgi:hypothetical protein
VEQNFEFGTDASVRRVGKGMSGGGGMEGTVYQLYHENMKAYQNRVLLGAFVGLSEANEEVSKAVPNRFITSRLNKCRLWVLTQTPDAR